MYMFMINFYFCIIDQTNYMNGILNGMQDQQTVQILNQQGVIQQNLIPVCKFSY